MNKNDPTRSCNGKVPHNDKISAENHIDILVLKGVPRRTLTHYKCRFCNKIHVASSSQNDSTYKKQSKSKRKKRR